MEAHDFSFIADTTSRNLFINGCHAVSRCEAWDFLKNYTPNPDEGFMFTQHPIISQIGKMMENCPYPPGHSGFSFGWTMRQLKAFAKNGYDDYKNMWLTRATVG
jgi:hypothetical protein